jgi:hypothetical protein
MRALTLGLSILLAGCGGRELGWLVPRASVGVVLRATDTGMAADGYVLLGAPLSGPDPQPARETASAPRQVHLLGAGPRCQLAPLCRWEAAARTQAFTDLAEEESP